MHSWISWVIFFIENLVIQHLKYLLLFLFRIDSITLWSWYNLYKAHGKSCSVYRKGLSISDYIIYACDYWFYIILMTIYICYPIYVDQPPCYTCYEDLPPCYTGYVAAYCSYGCYQNLTSGYIEAHSVYMIYCWSVIVYSKYNWVW